MKHHRIWPAILLAFIFNLASAEATPLETGSFKDQTGFVDKATHQKVTDAQNLMGYRYIAIHTDLDGSTIKSVEVLDKNNAPIKTGTPLNISILSPRGAKKSSSLLKLWLKMPAGTDFKVIYHFK
jgi:hypothetical protein